MTSADMYAELRTVKQQIDHLELQINIEANKNMRRQLQKQLGAFYGWADWLAQHLVGQ